MMYCLQMVLTSLRGSVKTKIVSTDQNTVAGFVCRRWSYGQGYKSCEVL